MQVEKTDRLAGVAGSESQSARNASSGQRDPLEGQPARMHHGRKDSR